MKIDVITIFPALFDSFFAESLLGKAVARGDVSARVHDLRGWASDKHRTVDDAPFGGDEGMVFKPEPLLKSIGEVSEPDARRIVMCPQGKRFDASMAHELSCEKSILVVCGRYEGIDARVIRLAGLERVSIGDFVLSGGEVAAMAVIEAVTRFVPGVVGRAESIVNESFEDDGLLDYPVFTRPSAFEGMEVPAVLLSGNHSQISRWRRFQRLARTRLYRPDLFEKAVLSKEDLKLLSSDEWEVWP